MFQRIRELAVQAASDTNAVDRPIIQVEVSALLLEIRRMSEDTNFNGAPLLDGSGQFGLQVGPHGGQLLGLNIPGLWSSTDADIDLRSHQGATAALSYLDTRLEEISKSRTLLGAYQSRLGFAADHAAMMAEQQEAALSRIQDLDYAAEVGKLTRAQILQQAAASMLAQANSQPRLILQLLR
jgi:flagellin